MARRRRNSSFRRKGIFSAGTRGRRILTWVLAFAAALVLVLIIGGYRLLSWLQSDSFRQQLAGIICNKAQAAEVSLTENLQINDDRVSLPGIGLKRADILQLAAAERVVATINRGDLLSRRLNISKLTMETATLRLDSAYLSTPLPPVREEEGGIWGRFTPDTFNLESFECTDADTELKLHGQTYSLTGCSISAAPIAKHNKREWQVNIENGRLHTPLSYLLNCSIKSATLLYTPTTTMLSECRMMLTPGELRMKGSCQNKNKQWYLDLKANKANVARLLSEDWKKRLTGELYGELKLTGTGERLKEASGNISLREGVLEGLPVLSQIDLGGTRPYRSIELEKAECRVSYPFSQSRHNIRNAWLFDRIDIRARDGILLVKGHVIVGSDGKLRGTLTIGVPEHIIAGLSAVHAEATERIFNAQGESGYKWLNLNLSGTVDAPQEDLSARLSAILTSTAIDTAGKTVRSATRTATELMNSLFASPRKQSEEAPTEEQTAQPTPSGISPTDVLDIIF
ncbi:MAG: hypothetical protein IKZ13_08035 [Akkermansia sp.]|nr:hypothetical protein [Akkermansia sp.]